MKRFFSAEMQISNYLVNPSDLRGFSFWILVERGTFAFSGHLTLAAIRVLARKMRDFSQKRGAYRILDSCARTCLRKLIDSLPAFHGGSLAEVLLFLIFIFLCIFGGASSYTLRSFHLASSRRWRGFFWSLKRFQTTIRSFILDRSVSAKFISHWISVTH